MIIVILRRNQRANDQVSSHSNNLPSLIFWSNSSKVGSISSQPSGGGFLLRRTFGITKLRAKNETFPFLQNLFLLELRQTMQPTWRRGST